MSVVRRRVRVGGHVQGVYYRATLREAAEARGVAGWARNMPDGTVEAVFEGPPEAVAELVDLARTGPPDARVEDVRVAEEPPAGLAGFSVA